MRPPSMEEIRTGIQTQVETIIDFCTRREAGEGFFIIEKQLQSKISELACMFFQLFLASFHERLDDSLWLETGLYYRGGLVRRKIKTIYGEVCCFRRYLIKKGRKGEGFYPLDMALGLTGDGFSPMVMSLATKLACRVSFAVSTTLFKCFYGWSPSSEAIEALVLGMGRDASTYMEEMPGYSGEGEILVIEVDGKATPTAREEELKKRRGKRAKDSCCCQRHRSKIKRQCRCKRKRRTKGDKSKNGRSITLVVMYTLRKGADGKLHGPVTRKSGAAMLRERSSLNGQENRPRSGDFHPRPATESIS